MKKLIASISLVFAFILLFSTADAATDSASPDVMSATHPKNIKVTILSTMLAEAGIGEWGFAALVEVDGYKVLFDTGARPETVLHNAAELHIDLSQVTEVVLSHFHDDHTGGLMTLRRALMQKNPQALSRVHVGDGIFESRYTKDGTENRNQMQTVKKEYEAIGGVFIIHDGAQQIHPGIWLTGPVARRFD